MSQLATIDWTAVGAIAGPVLALASLVWQASERLRRPLLEPTIGFQRYSLSGEEQLELFGRARVFNPRPSALIVRRIEIQERRWRLPRPWKPATLAGQDVVVQIPGADEATVSVGYSPFTKPRTLRVVVRFRGLTRATRGPWEDRAGADALERLADRR